MNPSPTVSEHQAAENTNRTMNQEQEPTSSSVGSSGIDWGSCGGFVVWAFATWWDWTVACLVLWYQVVLSNNLSEKGLLRISNLMLAWHYVGIWVAQVWFAETNIHTIVLAIPKPSFLPEKSQGGDEEGTWWLLLWALPLLTGGTTALVAVPYLIRLPQVLRHGAIVTSLVMVFFMEAMLPVVFMTCTCLCLFEQMSWISGISILAFVWIVVSLAAHWIRCLVYQDMGHG